MRILFFTKYAENGASSRYRTFQYLPFFKDHEYKVYPLLDENYRPGQYLHKKQSKLYIIKKYLSRMQKMFSCKRGDVIFLEYEFFPYLPFFSPFIKLLGLKYIVDYDDAIFHKYDQHNNRIIRFLLKNKIKSVIKHAKAVITGSPYLTKYAEKYSANVIEIPTSIDFNKYVGSKKTKIDSEALIIGWIGSSTTSKNLISLIPVFKKLKQDGINFELRFIGFREQSQNEFKDLPITFVKWSSETEVEEVRKFSVGIMPLEDNLFNRGKCAFKLIQYMACGVPTIATPMESNTKVDRNNGNLFANTEKEWYDSFIEINNHKDKYTKIGFKNIETIKALYSIQANNKIYKNIITKI